MESVALILLLALTYFFRLWRLSDMLAFGFCTDCVLSHPMSRVTMASCIRCGGMKHVVRAGQRRAAYLEPLRSLS